MEHCRPVEAGFVFLKLRNNVAAHKNTPDATHDCLQAHPIPAPVDGLLSNRTSRKFHSAPPWYPHRFHAPTHAYQLDVG
jgi:hypothetical protein